LNLFNYVNGLEIKMTKNKGRGVFATRNLVKDELLIVEKPVASIERTSVLN